MSDFPRSEEGFSRAFESARSMAARHPDKEYALYVDSRKPNRYGVSLAGLVEERYVEAGTVANVITAEGRMERMFQEGETPSP